MNKLWPEYDDKTLEYIRRAVESQRWAIDRPGEHSYIDEVEKELAQKFNKKYAITTCNGSAALVITLQMLGVGEGDLVIVPATTWIGVVTSILRVGAKPLFLDSHKYFPVAEMPMEYNLPINVKAVIVTHMYSCRANIIAWKMKFPNIKIIEDSSHCLLTTPVADATFASFQATKALTCSEGGAVFVDSWVDAAKLEALRADGRVRSSEVLGSGLAPTMVLGANYAMSEITAALLLDQLSRFDEQCERRNEGLRRTLIEYYGNYSILDNPGSCAEVNLNGRFYGMPILVSNPEEAIKIALKEGYGFFRVYLPVPMDPRISEIKRGYSSAIYPCSYNWYKNYIVIPHYYFLQNREGLENLWKVMEKVSK